jgi:hypothetical protein
MSGLQFRFLILGFDFESHISLLDLASKQDWVFVFVFTDFIGLVLPVIDCLDDGILLSPMDFWFCISVIFSGLIL